jgi:hypothetical protein
VIAAVRRLVERNQDGLLSEVSIERGVELDLTAYFNDVSAFLDEADGLDLRQAADARLPEEEASRLLAGSEITVTGAWDTQDSKFFLRAALGDTFRLLSSWRHKTGLRVGGAVS